jgi:hypothetical protein
VVKMTAAAVVASPKMQARKIREEAKVVRSINFPVPISVLSPVREAKLCPTDRAFCLLKLPEPGMDFRRGGQSGCHSG